MSMGWGQVVRSGLGAGCEALNFLRTKRVRSLAVTLSHNIGTTKRERYLLLLLLP